MSKLQPSLREYKEGIEALFAQVLTYQMQLKSMGMSGLRNDT